MLKYLFGLDATVLLISSKKQSAKGNENETEANARQNWFYHKYLLNSLILFSLTSVRVKRSTILQCEPYSPLRGCRLSGKILVLLIVGASGTTTGGFGVSPSPVGVFD
ncbi:hypothetical protein Pse7429DRAFT_3593 [Pseudanabaena biceps PCC 7429]|uniref:Uncharacterized protein n=1 Tax=Pseudanabaena biceps PCC 7429 TaxID=927668 RepID=L8MXU9_9CYAN|nr:hypothetical protein Pse7429DRAFT_3593 [Pseudanabaena biceps PCC 7429]